MWSSRMLPSLLCNYVKYILPECLLGKDQDLGLYRTMCGGELQQVNYQLQVYAEKKGLQDKVGSSKVHPQVEVSVESFVAKHTVLNRWA